MGMIYPIVNSCACLVRCIKNILIDRNLFSDSRIIDPELAQPGPKDRVFFYHRFHGWKSRIARIRKSWITRMDSTGETDSRLIIHDSRFHDSRFTDGITDCTDKESRIARIRKSWITRMGMTDFTDK